MFIDQTSFLEKLLKEGSSKVQVAVPRRFGKSTYLRLIEDLCREEEVKVKEMFANTDLGRSTFIGTEWKPPYPVIKFNFSKVQGLEPAALMQYLVDTVNEQCRKFKFNPTDKASPNVALSQLMEHIVYTLKKRVIVLVDEYDYPVYGAEKSALYILNAFYATFKDSPEVEKLIMFGTQPVLTKIGSATNDTLDLLQTAPFFNMFGFSQQQVETIFSDANPLFKDFMPEEFKNEKPRMGKREWALEQARKYLNGYCFANRESSDSVYNPYSVLRFFKCQNLSAFYSELEEEKREHLKKTLQRYPNLLMKTIEWNRNSGQIKIENTTLDKDNAEDIKMCWSLGALTVKKTNSTIGGVVLTYPNEEMRWNITRLLLEDLVSESKQKFLRFKEAAESREYRSMANLLFEILKPRDDRLDHEINVKSALHEGFLTAGLKSKMEKRTEKGNYIDILLTDAGDTTYVFELKHSHSAEYAMKQLQKKEYCRDFAEKIEEGKRVIGVGLNYSDETGVSVEFVRAYLTSGEMKYEQECQFPRKKTPQD